MAESRVCCESSTSRSRRASSALPAPPYGATDAVAMAHAHALGSLSSLKPSFSGPASRFLPPSLWWPAVARRHQDHAATSTMRRLPWPSVATISGVSRVTIQCITPDVGAPAPRRFAAPRRRQPSPSSSAAPPPSPSARVAGTSLLYLRPSSARPNCRAWRPSAPPEEPWRVGPAESSRSPRRAAPRCAASNEAIWRSSSTRRAQPSDASLLYGQTQRGCQLGPRPLAEEARPFGRL